jgi:DNA-binding transcriptional LysR family regulator
MDLLHLRSLLAVVQEGTIGQGARHLHVSQSALSRRLQQLEAELGAELFSQSGRRVVLTEAGRIAAAEAAVLVERYERMKAELRAHLGLEAGTVRIGGGATAVSYILPEAMARFRKRYPGVRFRLEEAGSREVEAAVIDDRVELGIVTLPVAAKGLDVRPLVRDRIVLVAAKEHALARRKRVTAADLQGQALIGFEAESAIRALIDKALRAAGVELNVVMEVRSIAAILRLVDSTASLGFVSELSARGRPTIAVQGLRIARELGLVTRRGRAISPAAQAFAELLGSERPREAPRERAS